MLHDAFMAAPADEYVVSQSTRARLLNRRARSVAVSTDLDVHVLGMALHNSLKDIEPHQWMDSATILVLCLSRFVVLRRAENNNYVFNSRNSVVAACR